LPEWHVYFPGLSLDTVTSLNQKQRVTFACGINTFLLTIGFSLNEHDYAQAKNNRRMQIQTTPVKTEKEEKTMRNSAHDDAMAEMLRDDLAYAVQLLNSILEDGDQRELLMTLRQMAKAFGGMQNIADSAQLSPAQLYRTLSSEMNPLLSSLSAILKAMGLRLAIQSARHRGYMPDIDALRPSTWQLEQGRNDPIQPFARPYRLLVVPTIVDQPAITCNCEADGNAPNATIIPRPRTTQQANRKLQPRGELADVLQLLGTIQTEGQDFQTLLTILREVLRQQWQFCQARAAPGCPESGDDYLTQQIAGGDVPPIQCLQH
jgi:probable addiction module antidote protein